MDESYRLVKTKKDASQDPGRKAKGICERQKAFVKAILCIFS